MEDAIDWVLVEDIMDMVDGGSAFGALYLDHEIGETIANVHAMRDMGVPCKRVKPTLESLWPWA